MTDTQVAMLLIDVALIVVVARLVGRLAQAIGQPAVLGEIIAGILLGPTLFHGTIAHTLFPADVRPYLSALSDIGLVLFMFVVGLEFDFRRLRGSGRIAATTSVAATVLPFGLGLLLSLYLAGEHHPANRLGFMLFTGVAVSITAFPVLARILTDRGMNRTLVGTIALSCAAVCDLAAWTMLAAVQAITGDGRDHWLVLLVVPFVALLRYGLRPALAWLLARQDTLRFGPVTIVLAGLFASAAATQAVGLHFVFGAFLFGLMLPRQGTEAFRERLLERAESATTLLLPMYFIVAGLKVDLSHVGTTGLVELALIMATAIAGKFGGTFLGARCQGLPARRSAVLATLMNTRGLTELIALSIGLRMGVLNGQLYSLMVVMAVVTTAMSGPLLSWLVGPEDRNVAVREAGHSLPTASR
jgi:Kef-type K+ transport system membrane component KefB